MGRSSPSDQLSGDTAPARGGAGLMLTMATIGFALTFWAWALLSRSAAPCASNSA